MSWVLALLGFAALIVFHEAGHFFAAKAVGMRVEKFYLFFPPRATSITRGETEYGIGWIPLGGYVKITGMNPEEEIPPEVAHRAYYAQPVWKRIVVIAAGPLVNLIIAFAILFALAFNFAPKLDSDGNQIISNQIGAIQSGSPAEGILRKDDRLISVDGVSGTAEQLRDQIAGHACAGIPKNGCTAATPAKLVIERDGKQIPVAIRPQYQISDEVPKLSPDYKRALVGFSYEAVPLNPGVGGAASYSVDTMWDVTSRTFTVISHIFNAEDRKQISGVVGNYEVTRQAIELGPSQALFLLAIISLSLAIINLFPFLPLDGGHIFWSIVEKLRGKPTAFATMEKAGIIGFALVMILAVIGFTNDIGRLTGDGIHLR
jgi:regulator of sigma E protease